MSSGKATVKSVQSADMVVLSGRPRAGGPPPTRTLGLNYIQAPKLGNKDRPDEPFAFAARNYLRKLLVGKEVMFRVDYTVPSTGREYGALFLNQENIAHMLVREGWADVREIRASEAENVDVEALYSYKAEAQAAKRGIWAEDGSGVRKAHYNLEGDAEEFLEKYKGKPLPAIIESIRDGSTVRACLILPNGEHQYITLMISGIKAPVVRQGVPNTEDLVEPFAEEAKFFVETRLLQREVRVILEMVGQSGNSFFGTIQHPAGNIAEALVSNGLAKVADWSITHVTGGPTVLREAERKAQASKLRLWQDHVSKSKGQDHEFDATVVRIMTGDTIFVRNNKGQERKLRLSNLKAPARISQPKGGFEVASFDHEAKEFLRKRLIGKHVHVTIDYVKPPSDQFPEATECATIKVGEVNIGEQLVLRGLADVIKSREDRSQFYDQLLVAEAKAKEEGKGKHSTKEPPKYKWTDASENATKAKQFLPHYQRGGRTQAIVEYVANGSRFRLIIPKESAKMTFVLGGIRCPRAARNPGEKSEPFGAEALDFVSRRCQQREVEIEVESLDKTGGFIGTMWLNKTENVAALLLEEGLATIHSYSADQSKHSTLLYSAERVAKQARKNVWANVDPDAVEEEEVDTTKPIKKEYLDVVVSEIVSGGHFYVQIINQQIQGLEKMMSELGIHNKNSSAAPENWKPKVNEIVTAKFTEDNQWYRAKVIRNVAESKSVEVIYVDYGNSETIPLSRVRPLPSQFSSLPNQAHEAVLSYIKVPELKDDYGHEAASKFRDIVSGRQLVGVVELREHNVMHLTLYDPEISQDPDRSLNAELVREGLATVYTKTRYARHPNNQNLIAKFQEATESAKRSRLNMFEYGDITADDE